MLRFLSERFDVDVVAPWLDGAEEVRRLLQQHCREVEFVKPSRGWIRRRCHVGPYERDPELASLVQQRLESHGYDAIQVEKPAMLPYLPSNSKIPVVLDIWAFGQVGALRALRHEHGLWTRFRNLVRLVRFSAFDTLCWPSTHCLLVVSEVDRIRCLQARPDRRVLLVPNGVDCARLRPSGTPRAGPPVLLFSGDMSFEPNVSAAVLLAREIFPALRRAHPDVQLRLVGHRPDPRVLACRAPNITVTGEVEDMLPHLRDATIYVAPHFTGAGTRTKLLEAFAVGVPVVTTSVGIEGIEAHHEREVMIADRVTDLSQAVLRLLEEPKERQAMGEAGRRLADERYDWSRCLAPLEGLYAGLHAEQPRC